MLFKSDCKAKHKYLMTDKTMEMHCDNLAKLCIFNYFSRKVQLFIHTTKIAQFARF